MDKFTKDAFEQAQDRISELESEAWVAAQRENNIAALEVTAIVMSGAKDMAKIIRFAHDNGLTAVLKTYATYCRMGGFKMGFDAGRKVMLEQF